MTKDERPSPNKCNFYVVNDTGVLHIGKIGILFCTLAGYENIMSWSDWKKVLQQNPYVVDGLGNMIPVEDFIQKVEQISDTVRRNLFHYALEQRPQWVLDGEVILDRDGFTINFREFI